MAIQTAGEQKYYDLIEEKVKKMRTAMIIWISFLALALISVFSNILLGGVFGALGVFLAVRNRKEQKEMDKELERARDKTEFFNQLIAPDALEVPDFQLIVTRDYIVQCTKEKLYIRPRSEIRSKDIATEKGTKVLILTDQNGIRHEAARAKKKDAAAFDKICRALQAEE